MKRKNKVLITKVLLFFILGFIGYYIIKEIYLCYRKKKNITTEPNLPRLLIGALFILLSMFIIYFIIIFSCV